MNLSLHTVYLIMALRYLPLFCFVFPAVSQRFSWFALNLKGITLCVSVCLSSFAWECVCVHLFNEISGYHAVSLGSGVFFLCRWTSIRISVFLSCGTRCVFSSSTEIRRKCGTFCFMNELCNFSMRNAF